MSLVFLLVICISIFKNEKHENTSVKWTWKKGQPTEEKEGSHEPSLNDDSGNDQDSPGRELVTGGDAHQQVLSGVH